MKRCIPLALVAFGVFVISQAPVLMDLTMTGTKKE
jgi:hypothetical protein